MHTVWFQAKDPLNTLPRALDVVRRMGFELCGLHVDGPPGCYDATMSELTMTFRVRGDLTAANLADRLRQIPGLAALTWRRGVFASAPLSGGQARHMAVSSVFSVGGLGCMT